MAGQCGMCDVGALLESMQEQKFQYGPEPDGVMLSAVVPVVTCSGCGFSYTDYRGERLRHDAVCAHLGVLTLKEIEEALGGAADSEVAAACGLPEEQVHRIRSGLIVPSAEASSRLSAYDNARSQ